MNPTQLLAHFDRISEAPDAIPRLRRFILDLAVRGKLIEQDPNDEPAAELLKRIQAEKTRLVKLGEIKRLDVEPITNRDALFRIPAIWAWTRLGVIGDWGSGSTPPRGNHDFYGGNITWLKSGELNDNRQLVGSEETITELAVEKGSFRLNRQGDVLIAMYGATIGKVAILAESAVTNQAVCGCTPFSGVFNHYLFLFLLSQREQFRLASEGGAQPNISKVKIVRNPLPLPPLPEQHRIVAKVDELMALCDQLEAAKAERESQRDRLIAASLHPLNSSADADASREQARFYLNHLPRLTTRPEHIKQLRQTILNLAVRGRLVPQDPNDEPAGELLKRIQAEKERQIIVGEIKKQGTIHEIQADEAWFNIPASWYWVRLGMVTQVHMGQSPPGETYNKTGEGIPLINGPVEFTEGPFGKTVVNQYTTSPTNLCEEGDLLLCVRGSTTGRTNIAAFRACIGRGVAAIRPLFFSQYIHLFSFGGYVHLSLLWEEVSLFQVLADNKFKSFLYHFPPSPNNTALSPRSMN